MNVWVVIGIIVSEKLIQNKIKPNHNYLTSEMVGLDVKILLFTGKLQDITPNDFISVNNQISYRSLLVT